MDGGRVGKRSGGRYGRRGGDSYAQEGTCLRWVVLEWVESLVDDVLRA